MADVVDKVLFARIGWMKYYGGFTAEDDRLIGGGSYNKNEVGGELYNFKKIKGKVYGYVQPPALSENRSTLRLDRIDPKVSRLKKELAGVTVIFVATDPDAPTESERQRVVGWYRNATVYRVPNDDPTDELPDRSYNLSSSDVTLVPPSIRAHQIPRGKGGMGEANVRYCFDERGQPSNQPWMKKALSYIDSYRRENLIDGPEAEVAQRTEIEIERAAGRQSNPRIRRVVEAYAMEQVKAYYERKGYSVEDRHATESFDLMCSKNRDRRRVEVKGTQTDGCRVQLTCREVALPSGADMPVDLCIVHSIVVVEGKQLKAKGGQLRRFAKWNPRKHVLRPWSYICDLDGSLGSKEPLV